MLDICVCTAMISGCQRRGIWQLHFISVEMPSRLQDHGAKVARIRELTLHAAPN